MINLDRDLLEAASSGLNFLHACQEVLAVCLRHAAADAACFLRHGRILAARGRLLKSSVAFDHLPDSLPELLFESTRNAVDVAVGSLSLRIESSARPPQSAGLRDSATHLAAVFRNLEELDGARSEIRRLRAFAPDEEEPPRDPILKAAPLAVPRQTLEEAVRLAATRGPLLLTGEPGTEREALARFVHGAGSGAGGPFVSANAGAYSADLPDRAAGGTLFVDGVDCLSDEAQAGLVQAIDAGMRVIGAPIDEPAAAAAQGRLLQDLYLRLRPLQLRLPPLRETPGTIARLAAALLRETAAREGRRPPEFTPRALRALQESDFPGNVSELRSIVQAALASERGDRIDLDALPAWLLRRNGPRPRSGPEFEYERCKGEFERDYLVRLVKHARGNVSVAARISGLDRSHLYRLLRKHGLTAESILKSLSG